MVGKPFTTVLFPPSILEWSDAGVDENLADRVLCFLKLQLLHVGLLIEKIPCSKEEEFERELYSKPLFGSDDTGPCPSAQTLKVAETTESTTLDTKQSVPGLGRPNGLFDTPYLDIALKPSRGSIP